MAALEIALVCTIAALVLLTELLNRRHERRMSKLYRENTASNDRLLAAIQENSALIATMNAARDANHTGDVN